MATPAEARGNHEEIIILDFGSQVTQLIARRIREAHVFCEVLTCETPIAALRERCASGRVRGLVLSGGPASVYEPGAPQVDAGVLELGVPVLGICYGMQLSSRHLGGTVRPGAETRTREYGRADLKVLTPEDPLFQDTPATQVVWMSHGDSVEAVPDVVRLAETEGCPMAAFSVPSRRVWCVQFHPEVAHTKFGTQILNNFATRICQCSGDWTVSTFADEEIARVRARVADNERVVLGLSGGVDSSVAGALLHRALGKRLTCIFVDTGLLRKGEAESVHTIFAEQLCADVRHINAGDRFLAELAGVTDPEKKRKIIGKLFVDVFKEEAANIVAQAGDGFRVRYLAQGTLYPDVIESKSVYGGPTSVIKSHHNVGGLPKDLGLDLIEPLRFLFKDEVRALGTSLGLSDAVVWRQPFPGPGLAVRIVGEVNAKHTAILREADAVVREEIAKAGLERSIWQSFAVLLPNARSVGVQGDARTYDCCCAIRAVLSTDGMTADWVRIPYDVLERMSSRITNEVRGINRVVYDITSKPPGTIEWE